ncbi:MAG: ribose-phosphate pyrophosphokinase [Terriglobia bacterium]
MKNDDLKIFTGTAHRDLAEKICESLNIPLGNAAVTRFSDGEVYFQILENVRGEDVFIIQPTCRPVDTTLMELLVMIDAFKRSSARRITAVLPYYGYARQDRKDKPRVPISSKLVADLISTAGANRVLTMDLHVPQIQGFFDIPVDHLFAAPVLVDYFNRLNLRDLIVVSPDAGGTERARAYAKKLNTSIAIIDKRRVEANVAEIMNIIGEVEGRTAVIVDDIIDTAGTLVKSAEALLRHGAKAVYACCTHPVLSGPAADRILRSGITEVVVTDTIPLSPKAAHVEKIQVLSVADLLGKAIQSIHDETSVSSLFI